MLVWYIACRCAMYQTRLKSDDYTCRTVRKRLVDGGSNPPSSTIHGGQNFLCLPFHLLQSPVFAGFRVFACGRDEAEVFEFFSQISDSSLFSLLACGRIHEASPVFMQVSVNRFDRANA